MKNRPLFFILALLAAAGGAIPASAALPLHLVFTGTVSEQRIALKELDPTLPADWSDANFLVLELKASSSQRFELGIVNAGQLVYKRIHPLAGVWLRAAVPLRFFRDPLGDGIDLAATVNQPRNTFFTFIEVGGRGPTNAVEALTFTMRYPVGGATLDLRSVRVTKDDPGDAVLDGHPVVDEFGQYLPADWPGKAHSLGDLKTAWAAEAGALTAAPTPDRCPYGGFLGTKAKATGFFHVEQIDGRWWFVCPDGHLFYSTGVNGIGTGAGTRVAGREGLFTVLPPANLNPAPAGPAKGGPPAGFFAGSFYTWNLQRRYGEDWRGPWAALTVQRMRAWGLNTFYGGREAALMEAQPRQPYVLTARTWQGAASIMGMPDVYSEDFLRRVEEGAAQLDARRDDPYLLGYFIGNEPPWPNRESQLVDAILAGPAGEMQRRLQAHLAAGDTPERRKEFVLAAFAHFIDVINTALRRHDPNHLNLGIRFGGKPPDDVVRLARVFDVYSHNIYDYAPSPERLGKLYQLTGRPILIGEFHIGTPGRGLAAGLVQAMNQEERGVAYRYYVEHAAAFPAVVGTHWFQWLDQPSTGRNDGEDYNIGWVDVTDQPYRELVAAAQLTHARLLDVHAGKVPPVDRVPKASEAGTPVNSASAKTQTD